jgi:hypothetical protein
MKRLLFFVPIALVMGVVSLLSSCGGGGTASPTGPGAPSPTPTGSPVRTVLIPAEGWSIPGNSWLAKNLDYPPVGTVDLSVDWGGSSNVDIFAVDSSCANVVDLQAGRCTILAKNETVGQMPKAITFQTVTNRIYTFYLHNTATVRVSGELHVGITTYGPIPPTPTPNPTDNPQANLAPGPVARVTLYIYQQYHGGKPGQGGEPEQKTQDEQGRWVLHLDDFVVFDSTQRNAAGDICRYNAPPVYTLEDPAEIFNVLGNSTTPFAFRVEVRDRGQAKLISHVDGIGAELTAIAQ